jgi:hypothetical protein
MICQAHSRGSFPLNQRSLSAPRGVPKSTSAKPAQQRAISLHHLQLLPPSLSARQARARNLFFSVLHCVWVKYQFALIGYVVMSERVQLLDQRNSERRPSTGSKGLIQGVSRRFRHRPARNPQTQTSESLALAAVQQISRISGSRVFTTSSAGAIRKFARNFRAGTATAGYL